MVFYRHNEVVFEEVVEEVFGIEKLVSMVDVKVGQHFVECRHVAELMVFQFDYVLCFFSWVGNTTVEDIFDGYGRSGVRNHKYY